MRMIDIDALPDDCAWCGDALIEAINDAPTIDAVEVVRCKDCKRADWYEIFNGEHRCFCMEHRSGGHTDDDYCSYGEREDGDPK